MASKQKEKKSKKDKEEIKTYRVCVLGPSFCGKTQIVNRIVNNSFE